uniref:Ig-like domain-containing protein n=1 Tax=Scleropages formosus TaxID=113540 RepID=A0A8D0CHL8_SCLFO
MKYLKTKCFSVQPVMIYYGISLLLPDLSCVFFLTSAACSGFDVTVDVRPPAGTVGGSVLFAVSINPPPGSLQFVAWNFGGTNIVTFLSGINTTNPTYTGRIVFNPSTGSLELKNLTVDDTGRYTLNIQPTGATTAHKSFNDTVSVKCFANGSSLTFQWLNGSSHITVSERVQLSDNNRTLTISNVLRSDGHSISCNVSNIISSNMSTPLILNIIGPDNASVIVTPKEQFYSSGSSISLLCSAQSSPDAQFQWHFNGAKLDKVGKELKLENIQQNQSGNYSCWAHNTVTLRYHAHASCFKVLHEFFSSAAAGLHYSLRSVEGYCELSVQQIPPPVPRQYYLRAHSEEHYFTLKQNH